MKKFVISLILTMLTLFFVHCRKEISEIISVEKPNYNTQYFWKTSQKIYWKGIVNGKLRISLFKDNRFLREIATNISASQKGFSWNVPENICYSKNCKILVQSVQDETKYGYSETFSILPNPISIQKPQKHTIWIVESIDTILWNYSRKEAKLNIQLFRSDSTNTMRIIAGEIPNNGKYAWRMPSVPVGKYVVRISDIADTSGQTFCLSDTFFVTKFFKK